MAIRSSVISVTWVRENASVPSACTARVRHQGPRPGGAILSATTTMNSEASAAIALVISRVSVSASGVWTPRWRSSSRIVITLTKVTSPVSATASAQAPTVSRKPRIPEPRVLEPLVPKPLVPEAAPLVPEAAPLVPRRAKPSPAGRRSAQGPGFSSARSVMLAQRQPITPFAPWSKRTMQRRQLLGASLAMAAASAFGSEPAQAASEAVSRVRPGAPGWPSDADWTQLSQAVGGRLGHVPHPDLTGPDGARQLANPFFV